MLKKSFLKIATALLFMISLAGCGDAGNTNGTLTLTTTIADLFGGRSFIRATAVVSRAVPGIVPGIPITFTGQHAKKDGTLLGPLITKKLETDSNGSAEMQFYADQDTAEVTYFEVTATVDGGGLFKATTVTIPIFTP